MPYCLYCGCLRDTYRGICKQCASDNNLAYKSNDKHREVREDIDHGQEQVCTQRFTQAQAKG